MDKNTVIGLLLIVAVLIGFSYWNSGNQPKPQVQQQAQVQKQAAKPVEETPAVTHDTTTVFAGSFAAQDTAQNGGKDSIIVLKNDNITLNISKKGGTISDVYLNNYLSYKSFVGDKKTPLHLYSKKDASLNFNLKTTKGTVRTEDYIFVPTAQQDSTKVTMLLKADDNSAFAITYELLPGDNYMLNVSISAKGLGQQLTKDANILPINWKQNIQMHEKGYYFENNYSQLTYKLTGDDTETLSSSSNDKEAPEDPVDWIAFKNQYFSSIMLAPKCEMSDVSLVSIQVPEIDSKQKNESTIQYLKRYSADMSVPFDPTGKQATELQFFFGPNGYNLLKSMDKYKLGEKDYDLEGLVYLGWPIVKWVNRYFTIYVFDFLTQLGLPMYIVLLLITLLLRVIVYAPTRKSFLSSAKMRVLRPKVDELNKKYPRKEDAMKKQQEMMTLYSQYGVSPMGGCLPMLIQMPIWIAMFNFIPNAIELRQQGFLWAEDLSAFDSVISFGTDIWGIGDHLSIFCLLFCGTNLLYSYMTIRQQRESMSSEQMQQMKMMQWMMYLMPVMFFFMFNKYPAGLSYYYFISLLASALTMWYLRRTTDDAKLLEKLEANYKANKNDPNKKPRGLAARLEALNRQAAEMDAQRRNRK